jgi:hypothetical protein
LETANDADVLGAATVNRKEQEEHVPTMSPQCEVIHRGEPEYEPARRATCRNRLLPDRFPDVIVRATSTDDVVAAIGMAKAENWKVGVRSGGHSWSCNHVRDGGLLLDLSSLNEVQVDIENMVAVVGPGVRSNELDVLLDRLGVFFPVGHCEGVGLGGYLLQGGFGWNSRALGVACESVLGLDYVDGDGELRHASPTENSDIYWAARGSGPGFFGVVTQFHLRLYPRPRAIGGQLGIYPLEKFGELVRWGHQVGPTVPTTVELMLVASRRLPHSGAPGVLMIVGAFADDVDQAHRDLAFLDSRPDGAFEFAPFTQMSLESLTKATMAMLPEDHFHVVDNIWTHAGADELLPVLDDVIADLPPAPSHLIWMNWSPKKARPQMAFSLEDETYLALYGVYPESESEQAVTDWVMDKMAKLAPFSSGIQLADENLERRDDAFMADANRERLEQIRRDRDPQGRFHSYHGAAK